MKWYDWKPYVPVAVRRTRALKKMEKLQKKGLNVQPVEIEGRKIARTFWGEAWCDHLESFSDYENRLPRGRTYVRNGSVCHLDISKGEINAMVGGSDLYKVKVSVKMLSRKRWKEVKDRCAGRIGSLIELLQGRLSENVMKVVTDRNQGLFPLPGEINLQCSCPDWAVMCKHVAAVLYGVGARLDEKPELLFLLRGVDHEELISAEAGMVVANIKAKGDRRRIEEDALADVFGIEMSEEETPAKPKPARGRKTAKVKPAEAKPTRRRKATAIKPAKDATRSHGRTRKSAIRKKKKPAARVSGANGAPRKSPGNGSVTGKAVARLRAEFGLSQSEFARLLGVSAPCVNNWEKKPGKLDLRPRTRDAWNTAKALTKHKARRKLDG